MLQRLPWGLTAAAAVLLALATALAFPAVHGVKLLDGSTDNPTVSSFSMNDYPEAVVTIEVADGSHAVTISSRDCTDGTCAWVTETAAGGTVTSSAPHKVRIGWHYEIQVSVANATEDAVTVWYSLGGAK